MVAPKLKIEKERLKERKSIFFPMRGRGWGEMINPLKNSKINFGVCIESIYRGVYRDSNPNKSVEKRVKKEP